MAPKLDDRTREQIKTMLAMPNLSNSDIARICKVNSRTVTRHRKNMNTHGVNVIKDYTRHNPKLKVKVEHKEVGISGHRHSMERNCILITSQAVLEYMEQHPDAQQKAVADYINETFNLGITGSTVCRILKSMGWKTKRAQIKEQRRLEQIRAQQALVTNNAAAAAVPGGLAAISVRTIPAGANRCVGTGADFNDMPALEQPVCQSSSHGTTSFVSDPSVHRQANLFSSTPGCESSYGEDHSAVYANEEFDEEDDEELIRAQLLGHA